MFSHYFACLLYLFIKLCFQGHPLTAGLNNKVDLSNLEADLEFEQPDQHLYEFHGRLIYDNGRIVPLGKDVYMRT